MDPVSANSEKGRVVCKGRTEIAVEIRGERSSPRNESGTNCVEAPAIRGGLPSTSPTQPNFG